MYEYGYAPPVVAGTPEGKTLVGHLMMLMVVENGACIEYDLNPTGLWSLDDPDEFPLDMVVDSNMKAWFASAASLSGYDGANWSRIELSTGEVPESERIAALEVDSQDRLWLGLNSGIFQLEAGKLVQKRQVKGLGNGDRQPDRLWVMGADRLYRHQNGT